jgi:hypothetical protein
VQPNGSTSFLCFIGNEDCVKSAYESLWQVGATPDNADLNFEPWGGWVIVKDWEKVKSGLATRHLLNNSKSDYAEGTWVERLLAGREATKTVARWQENCVRLVVSVPHFAMVYNELGSEKPEPEE